MDHRRVAALLLLLFSGTDAFVTPSNQVRYPTCTSLDALPEFNPFLLSDGLSAATYMGKDDLPSSVSGPLSALRTFFIIVTAAIFGITALAYLTAAFLVPKAAEQLEQDTKRLRPGLWEEYEAKLLEGESMANRPDLLQELGNIMQPIIVQDYEKEAAMKFGDINAQEVDSTSKEGGSVDGRTTSANKKGDIIDVTIKQADD